MTQQKNRIFWSLLLIGLGIYFLLNNFRIFGTATEFFFAAILGSIGVLGIGYFLNNRQHWWTLFLSFVFLGIAGSIVADKLPFLPYNLGGSIFLFALALAFWAIFITQSPHWWAAIPAGILTTLAFITILEEFVYNDNITGSLLFVGIGLTFGLLWLMRSTTRTGWAKWPALASIGMAVFIPLAEDFDLAWPIILIVVGVWLLWKNIRRADRATEDEM